MNYQKIYDAIIFKRQNVNRLRKQECYCESHHIIPKSLGGTNQLQNLVNLLPREHYICHRLLVKIMLQKFGKDSIEYFKMIHALIRMSNYKKYKNFRTSRIYEIIRKDFIYAVAHNASITNKGKKLSEKRKLQNKIDSSNRRWMCNIQMNESHFVKYEEIDNYLANGFIFGRIIDQSGSKNPIHKHNFSKKECVIRSKRRALLNKTNPPAKGKIWINNGNIEKYILETIEIPTGYIKGRLRKSNVMI